MINYLQYQVYKVKIRTIQKKEHAIRTMMRDLKPFGLIIYLLILYCKQREHNSNQICYI